MYDHALKRIQYFTSLKEGWLDGLEAGEPISRLVASRAYRLLYVLYLNDLPEPLVFPTEDGFIMLEWHLDTIITIDVEPDFYYLFVLDPIVPDNSFNKADAIGLGEVVEFALEYVLQ